MDSYGSDYGNDIQMLYREGLPILMDDCLGFLIDKIRWKTATAEDISVMCNCIQTSINIMKLYSVESGAD